MKPPLSPYAPPESELNLEPAGKVPLMPWQAAVAHFCIVKMLLFSIDVGAGALLFGGLAAVLLSRAGDSYEARQYRSSIKTHWAILIVAGLVVAARFAFLLATK